MQPEQPKRQESAPGDPCASATSFQSNTDKDAVSAPNIACSNVVDDLFCRFRALPLAERLLLLSGGDEPRFDRLIEKEAGQLAAQLEAMPQPDLSTPGNQAFLARTVTRFREEQERMVATGAPATQVQSLADMIQVLEQARVGRGDEADLPPWTS